MNPLYIFITAILAVNLLQPKASDRPEAQLTREEADGLDRAADEMLEEMTVDEREVFFRQVQDHVVSQIRAAASRCGTDVTFTDEARFEDRSVLIDSSATSEQTACVQAQYPFAKPQH